MRNTPTRLLTKLVAIPAVLILSAAAGLAAEAPAASDDAAGLVKKAVDALPKKTFKAKMKLTPQHVPPREVALSHKVVNGARASYLEVIAPDELQGIRFLFLERPGGEAEQYVKIASARNPVRVTDQIRKQPFLESNFYISDLVEPELDAYTYKFAGESGGIGGRAVKLVEATPKNPEKEIYGKTILAIDPKDNLILRREFFDKSGKPLKIWTADVVETVQGVPTIRDQWMENIQEKTKSRLQTTEIQYDVELSDSMFSPDYLKR